MPEACRMCGDEAPRPLGEVKGYPWLECAECLFVFSPALTGVAMERLYASGYHDASEGAPEAGWEKEGPAIVDPALARLPERTLTMLDFGTGQSRVPDALRARGHRVVAVDLQPPVRPHPDRVTGPLETLDLAEASFDLVFSHQVFEHLPEPAPTLRRLLRLAGPGGLVLVHTDMETPERTGGFASWWYVLPPDHCAYYRHRTFERFVEGTTHRVVWKDAKRVIIRRGA